uniref:NADH-ubiquinone oxidoreductase chain 6 n=1 Tax=Sipalinus gigas TaxID=1078824 RepID=A0A7H1DNR5_9CUCU|nr:NADH dehydrogenase subunit 6 [Sipalinus gigas]QNS38623.1 NADH dehydrogenase subunit 6 [Sipalinus gigas]
MLTTLLVSTIIMAIAFSFLRHPLSLGFVLLTQTILIAMITGSLYLNYWFSYILFLIMVSGMLVLLIYMTSVASNEKFKFSYKLVLSVFVTLIMMSPLIFMDKSIFTVFVANSDSTLMVWQNQTNLTMSKYFSYPAVLIMMMLITYLFLTLIAVVKITDINMGPLRQKS